MIATDILSINISTRVPVLLKAYFMIGKRKGLVRWRLLVLIIGTTSKKSLNSSRLAQSFLFSQIVQKNSPETAGNGSTLQSQSLISVTDGMAREGG